MEQIKLQVSYQETTELNSKEDIKHIFDRFILKKMSQSSIISVEKIRRKIYGRSYSNIFRS